MSSGNPFRTSLSHNPAASSHVPQTSFVTSDSSVPRVPEDARSGLEDALPPRTKKHVRIESNTTFIPPHPDTSDADDSPQSPLAQRASQSEHVNTSFPAQAASRPTADVFAGRANAQAAARGYDMATPDIWAARTRGHHAPQSAAPSAGVPANPFSRTLATIEPQERDTGEARTAAERPGLGNNRASLNVESFKTLLLTGKPGPYPPSHSTLTAAQSNVPSGAQFESSSSTDTSSISRQSLFEPPQQTHLESPRTSFEMPEEEEDESMSLVSEVKKGKKKPPPAPKHRHGKLVTSRQPQTVSFDSFAAWEPAPSPITQSKDNSDANKPLPPTPVVSPPALPISAQDSSQPRAPPAQQYPSESLAATELPKPQKKTPPPVPLARRQSQLRGSTSRNRSRSNSNLTMNSQHSADVSLSSSAPSNTDPPLSVAKSPPPPPRSRHGARLTDISISSTISSGTELPQRSASVRTANSMQDAITSRRSTLDPGPPSPADEVGSTSSISLSRNAQRAVSNESSGGAMPPPPPPPRRRNRSSLDQQRPNMSSFSPTESRRTSVENRRTSIENNRRTSIACESSLRRNYAPVEEKRGSEYAPYPPNKESENKLGSASAALTDTGSESNNILDDMDKFQREIEELRQRYQQTE
ncbi:hypothetical protein BDU57DRAFT_20166 [Ampelomyces quisqualis]|uniref:Uncharacterized protein n=1 Tax=Ampelomyces quisqualis TaxID=50730 RepID=A0A6A5QXT9_AMPQU|nr:hypothetical protein BDU57DRAFT_20166 [Ampelomyces quisqualis]